MLVYSHHIIIRFGLLTDLVKEVLACAVSRVKIKFLADVLWTTYQTQHVHKHTESDNWKLQVCSFWLGTDWSHCFSSKLIGPCSRGSDIPIYRFQKTNIPQNHAWYTIYKFRQHHILTGKPIVHFWLGQVYYCCCSKSFQMTHTSFLGNIQISVLQGPINCC